MKSTRTVVSVVLVCAAVLFGIRVYTNTAQASFATHVDHAPVPEPSPKNAPTATADVKTSGGLTTVTFDTNPGTIRVNLTDDMRAGDTISGTVVAEPKGQTEEERAKNRDALKSYDLQIKNPLAGKESIPSVNIKISEPLNSFTFTVRQFSPDPVSKPGGTNVVPKDQSEAVGTEASSVFLPVQPVFNTKPITADPQSPLLVLTAQDVSQPAGTGGEVKFPETITVIELKAHGGGNLRIFAGDGSVPQASTLNFQKLSPNLNIANATSVQPPDTNFQLPTLGQQGRPLEIFGHFDGDASNTTLRFIPPGGATQNLEKKPETVTGGYGPLKPLAESPRKLVFESPSNVTGPVTILVKEGDGAPTTGTMRNVGVRLTAPKTNLLKGEKTTLTIEVTGLEGIQKPVPLNLTSEGVITMEGGPYQPLMIQPAQVDAGGRYSTTRGVTGIQAGGWGATATVIVRRFDFCLQDDTDPNRLFHFNSFTGDYVFACGGGSCSKPGGPGGTTQTGDSTGKPGGTSPPPIQPSGVTLTGIGRPAMKGCIITLSHNAPDRRVFARLDACTKSGDASVETTSPKAKINITDKNTADNTATSPPPK